MPGQGQSDYDAGYVYREPVREITIFVDRYDLTISLLILDRVPHFVQFEEADPERDAFDVIAGRASTGRRE